MKSIWLSNLDSGKAKKFEAELSAAIHPRRVVGDESESEVDSNSESSTSDEDNDRENSSGAHDSDNDEQNNSCDDEAGEISESDLERQDKKTSKDGETGENDELLNPGPGMWTGLEYV